MGLSLKQVSMEEFDWSKALIQAQKLELPKVQKSQNQNQNQIQQNIEQLKCPRCDSTNTKFCYYNNYNKSQPRHFCRACKRHWTNGGTLRNIPVGGCRKNKRLKKTTKSAAVSAAASTSDSRQNLPLFQSLFPPTEFENFTINYGIINSQKICNQSDQDELIHVETEETWQYPGTADMSESYWSWDDIQTFAATDLNIAWDHHDGHDIKP